MAPGEVTIIDDHYGGPRRSPARAVRARSGPERAFLALGGVAEPFLREAAAASTTKLGTELGMIVGLEAAWGREALDLTRESLRRSRERYSFCRSSLCSADLVRRVRSNTKLSVG